EGLAPFLEERCPAADRACAYRCKILHLHLERASCAKFVLQKMAHGNVQRGREDTAVQRALRVEHERIDLEANGAPFLIVGDLHSEKAQEKKGAELLALLAERPIKHLPCAVSAHLLLLPMFRLVLRSAPAQIFPNACIA